MLALKRLGSIFLPLSMLLLCAQSQANVILGGTRIILSSEEKEASIQLSNEGENPSLVQAWLDKGQAQQSPSDIDVPFVVTPTMFRIDAGKTQTVRVIHSGEPLPQDRESLFWFNVLDVPPKGAKASADNLLQFAFRTRVKLMYRPQGLPGKPADAPEQLRWSIGRDLANQPVLKASNPSAYVVNIAGIKLESNGKSFSADIGPVLPGATAEFTLQGSSEALPSEGKVIFSSINDWGAATGHEAAIAR